MKIIQVIPALSSGGAQRITVDIANKLSEDHDVFLVQLYGNRNKKTSFYKNQLLETVNYINLNGKINKIFEVQTFFHFYRLVIKIRPDIIHTHLNITYSLIFTFFFKKRIKYFHTIHTVPEKECLVIKGISFKKVIRRYYSKNRIYPITVSQNSKEAVELFYNLSNSILIKNGCSQLRPSEKNEEVKNEIEVFKTSKDDVIFITIARCTKVKNHIMLTKVFNRLIKEGEKVKLIIIGEGFDSLDGKRLIEHSVVGVHFLGARENVSDYLLNSDAFCLSSLEEGLPISLLEALSTGCIPVCTPAGGIPNVIKNENIGFISKDYSEKEFYNTIKRFLELKGTINKEFIKEYFLENYSISKTVAKLLLYYEK